MDSLLRIVIIGHVDHGKSTVVGRLLNDTGSLPDGKVDAVREMSERRGMPFEWAFVMDALKAERDQGITIDTAQIHFHTRQRHYVIIDAPGHKEFLKNMITGAAAADAAVLVIDAHDGLQEQTRRHAYIASLLGIRQVVVVVNKMDLAGYDLARFQDVAADIRRYLSALGLNPREIIPVVARDGDNLAMRSVAMSWYGGPTLTEALDEIAAPSHPEGMPLRFPVQDIYKFDDRRIIAGRIESGRLAVGDEITLSPSGKSVRVATIESWHCDPLFVVSAGQSVGITLDEQIFIERGDIISHVHQPPVLSDVCRARIFWMGREPLQTDKRYKLRLNTAEYWVHVEQIESVVDTGTLETSAATQVERNSVAQVVLRSRGLMAVDDYALNPRMGRFVLIDGYDIAGGGIISLDGYPDRRHALSRKSSNTVPVAHRVSLEQRWRTNGHRSGILWMTGLSAAGKSTLAMEMEQWLFRKGVQVTVLDGDNVRQGLCGDLGFSPDDRAENIRRVGEMAHILAQCGMIVISAFISPYRADRDRVRAIGPELFHEVYVSAGLDVCEKRDPKGLYGKARAGKIHDFTGISAPYEAPENPELVVDSTVSIEESLIALKAYVEETFLNTPLHRGE